MKKKKLAFTLAEVLITLTILGVVAAIAVPSLIQMNTKRTQITKLAKAYSSLEGMAQNLAANTNCIGRDIACTGLLNISDEVEFGKKFIDLAGLRTLRFYEGRYPNFYVLNYKKINSLTTLSYSTPFAGTYANMIYAPLKKYVGIYDKNKKTWTNIPAIFITIFTNSKDIIGSDGKISQKANSIYGRDVFVFAIYDNFKVEPIVLYESYIPLSQIGYKGINKGIAKEYYINRYCNPDDPNNETSVSGAQGTSCAAKIIYDGWKMKY